MSRKRAPWKPKVGDRVVAFGRIHGRVSSVSAWDVVVELDKPEPIGGAETARRISAPLDRVEAEREGA